MNKRRVFALSVATPAFVLAFNAAPAMGAPAAASCDGARATMVVTSHSPHVVRGTSHRDVIVVKSAGHVILAFAGDDKICGSSGKDDINGGFGHDRIFGNAGDDKVVGGPGNDTCNGGNGQDTAQQCEYVLEVP